MRKVRRSHTKSRKGCLQCKNGHVKVSVAGFFLSFFFYFFFFFLYYYSVGLDGIVMYSRALQAGQCTGLGTLRLWEKCTSDIR